MYSSCKNGVKAVCMYKCLHLFFVSCVQVCIDHASSAAQLCESVLVRDLIFVFQNIEGEYRYTMTARRMLTDEVDLEFIGASTASPYLVIPMSACVSWTGLILAFKW